MNTKLLRSKVLSLAISGRLTPQDPNDEPASALLHRINPKATPIAEDVPFSLPDNWCWCRLGDIFDHNTGKALNKSVDTEGQLLPYLTTSNVYWDKFDLTEVRKMYFKESEIDKCTVREGDLLVCEGGDIGRSAIWNSDKTICIQNHLHRLRAKGAVVNHRFYLYVLMLFKEKQLIIGKGIGLMGLSSRTLDNLPIPLPPLAEQERIAKEVERWFACIEQLERSREALGKAAQQTKRTLLSLAISGRLVPQCPSDEPAFELLRRINPKVTPLNPDEPLPQGWTACRLEDIVDYEQPQAYIVESTDYSDNYETPVLTAGKSFIKGYTKETSGIYKNLPCIIFDDFTTDSRYIDFPFKVKSSAMKILRVHAFSTKYVALFMSITKLIGDTHKRYWISEYSKLSIPLPPLAEQERIVRKVEELFAVLDSLQ